MTGDALDMVFEVKLAEYDAMTEELRSLKDIQSLSLIAHKGETVL